MSAVLTKTKQHYQQVLTLELIMFGVLAIILLIWRLQIGISFLLGVCCALLPFGLIVYWMFFRKGISSKTHLKAFYCGETLKWLATILLIIFVLMLYPTVHILGFFAGYFLALVVNGFMPLILFQRAKSSEKSS